MPYSFHLYIQLYTLEMATYDGALSHDKYTAFQCKHIITFDAISFFSDNHQNQL